MFLGSNIGIVEADCGTGCSLEKNIFIDVYKKYRIQKLIILLETPKPFKIELASL